MAAETTQWSKKDVRKLLASLRKHIPANKRSSKYSIELQAVDWNKVAFHPFTPTKCLKKWRSIMSTVRKSRSLAEIIDEAATDASEKIGYHKVEDDVPSRPPCNGFILFCKERQKSLPADSKSRKVGSNRKMWEELTKEQRSEYGNRCVELWKEYKVSQASSALKTKRRKINQEPNMPTRSSYTVFFQEQLKLHQGKPSERKAQFKEICKKWTDLPDIEKKAYKQEAERRMAKYSHELREWFQNLSRAEKKVFLQHNPKKKKYLVAKRTPVTDKEDHPRHRPWDLEDGDSESGSSSDEFFSSEVVELEGDGQGDIFEVF